MANRSFDDGKDDARAVDKNISTIINGALIALFVVLAAAIADVELERAFLHRGGFLRSNSVTERLVIVPLLVLGILIAKAKTTGRQWLIGTGTGVAIMVVLVLAFCQ